MAKTIVEVKKEGNFDKGVGYVPPLDIINNFSAVRGSDQLQSRSLVKKDVVLSLKDPKISKIGVYGISGVGKTTLVKEVAKQVKDDKLFDAVVMVTISQTNLERIRDEIAEQLGLHLEGMTSSSGRANHLCERIKKEKTVLIILDDLWEKIDLEELGIPFLDTHGKLDSEKMGVPLKDDYKGCKLLLTSRSEDILQRNDTQKNFHLQLLGSEESWRLFEAMVGEVKDDRVQTIATQVAQRCLGFPVLIVTTAKSLKDKRFHYWQDTLTNLKRVDNKDVQETFVSALEFNLNRLEDEVKKVFLLCGVLGTFIHISDVLKYAIGLGIFKHVDTIEDARNRLYRITDDLKASCLLIDVDAGLGMIGMHDSVREGAVLIASKYVFTKRNSKLQDWPGKDILERCTHIILKSCCVQKLPERLDFPHLTFLVMGFMGNQTLEIPDTFFEGVQNLEALDLTGMIMSSLPISLRYLTKLKTLCLDSCSLKDMTGIGALKKLEILSLLGSSMEEFPSEIEQLTGLRMLDLSQSRIETTLPNILYNLTKIEELYMGNAIIKWEVESSSEQKTNVSLPKLSHLICLTTLEIQVSKAWLLPKDIPFDKLERYKIVIGDKWEWSNNKETLRLLKVKLDTNIQGERGIKTLIERAEDLYLDKISGISNVLFELNGEGFPSLKHLHIQNNCEIQHIINSMKRNQMQVLFPKLETLILQNLNNLVKICHGPVRNNSFSQLKFLKVKSCDQLICLFSVSVVRAFSHLVAVRVSECNSMTKIVSLENAESGKIVDDNIEFLSLRSLTLHHLPVIYNFYSQELTSLPRTKQSSLQDNSPTPFFSAKVKFSNLETLTLSSVNLKTIWDDKTPCLMENLANLTVEDCSGLKYLFPSSMAGKLSNLKQLEISKCDTIEKIVVVDEKYGVALREHICSEGCQLDPVLDVLEHLYVEECSNLKHLVPSSVTFNHLTYLEVQNCSGLMYLITSATARSLVKLTTLKIIECDSIEQIVVEQGGESTNEIALNSLEFLELDRLSKLQMFCSSNCLLKLPLLEKLLIQRCPRMTSFSVRETSAPMLQKIVTDEEDGIWCWEGDLTRTVSKMFQDMSASTSRALSYEEEGAESKANEIDDSGKPEMHKHTIPHTAVDPPSQALEAVTSSIKNEALQNQEMYDISVERPLVQSTKIALSTGVHDAATGTHVMQESIDKPFVQATQTAWDITIIQEKEESYNSDIHLAKNMFDQTITSRAVDYKKVVGTQEENDSKSRFSIHDAQNVLSPTVLYDTATGTKEMNEAIPTPFAEAVESTLTHTSLQRQLVPNAEDMFITTSVQDMATGTRVTHKSIDKPFVEARQNARDITIVQNKEELHDSDISPGKKLFNQTTTPIAGNYKERNTGSNTSGKADDSEVIHRNNFSHQTTNLVMAENQAVVDPIPSQASKASSSSTTPVADVCSSFKEVDRLLPYLEVGVKRHPQVLDWFNTKPRRAFAGLFTEVTSILGTTRRRDLKEDNRNYIRECCTALEAVGFDASWLNYVYGCIESCGDGDELMRKLEETEAKVSTLRNELASTEASLASLRDEASRLDDFIGS